LEEVHLRKGRLDGLGKMQERTKRITFRKMTKENKAGIDKVK